MKVKTIKNFHSLHNKALDSICVKSCVCVCVSFSLSFFYQFSGMKRILSLINLQLFPAVTKSARHKKAVWDKNCSFHTSFTYFRMAEFLSVVLALLIAF